MGQLVLGVAGAVVGNMIAPGIGASIGFALGSAAGSYLFQEKIEGPRNTDLKIQSSQYGTMITILYGTQRFTGQVIWGKDKVDHPETSGGKGGPEITTYTVTQSFAVGLGEGPEMTVKQVFANGRLVYDTLTGLEEISFTEYSGSETQLPDPTMEALDGVGNVPAYRGTAYVVFTDLPLIAFGNMIPNLSFVCSKGSQTLGPVRTVIFVDGAESYAWPLEDTADPPFHPLHPAIVSFPRSGGGDIRIRERNSSVVHVYSSTTLLHTGTDTPGDDDYFPADHINGIGAGQKAFPIGVYVYTDGSTTPLWTRNGSRIIGSGNIGPQITSSAYLGPTMIGTNWAEDAGLPLGEQLTMCALSQNGKIALAITTDAVDFTWHRIVDGEVTASGACTGDIANGAFGCSITTLLQGVAVSLENNGRYLWMFSSFDQQCTVYVIGDDDVLRLDAVATALDLPAGSNGLVSVGSIATLSRDGYAGVVFDDSLALLSRFTTDTIVTTYADVVANVSQRVGLTAAQYDVSEIEDPMDGLTISNQMPGRAIIEALLPCDYFDMVDSDCRAKAVKRGGASVMTIDPDDLGAFADGEESPYRVKRTRALEQDLPSRVDVVFPDIDADFQNGVQGSPRPVGNAGSPITISTAVAMTNRRGKEIADSFCFSIWHGRDRGTMSLPPKYLILEPTDIITLEDRTERINSKHEAVSGVTTFDFSAELAELWLQGTTPAPGVFVPQVPLEAQDTELEIIDAPYIVDEFRQAVIQVGMQGEERRAWKGATLMKSLDGTNYDALLTETSPDTIGETLTALANFGGGNVFDYSSSVEVEIHPGGGELSESTEDAVLAGANEGMIGAECVQWVGAELIAANTYRLCNGLLRGRRGTEWAMRGHAVGDRFIVLPTKTTIDAVYADYGLTRQYKAVTFGRTLATADAVDFRSNGVSVAPYAPAHLALGFNGSGDVLIDWVRRARIHHTWLDWVDVPLDEATESYRVQVWEDATYQTVVASYVHSGPPPFTYTVAQQTTDFGGPLTIPPAVSVAQIGRLGPGYDTLGRLPDFVPDTVPGYVPPNPPPSEGINDTITWASSAQAFSGPMAPNDVWIIEFTTAGVSSTPGDRPSLTAVEFGGPPAPREWVLSLVAGDFSTAGKKQYAHSSGSSTVFCVFGVGTDTDADYPIIPLTTTAYLNIRNLPSLYADVPMVCNLVNVP